jgi:hypothetical protein
MREFTLGTGMVTVAGATTLNILGAASAPSVNVEFLRHWVGQNANATSAQQRIQFGTEVVGGGFGTFTATTPVKLKAVDAASTFAGSTAVKQGSTGTNCSSEGTPTKTAIWDDVFNVLNGFLKVNTPAETELLNAQTTSIAAYLIFPVAPGTLTSWTWGQTFREI